MESVYWKKITSKLSQLSPDILQAAIKAAMFHAEKHTQLYTVCKKYTHLSQPPAEGL